MQYTKEFDINEFRFWSGAKDTMKSVFEVGKEDELQTYIEDRFSDKTPTATDINDFVWFERDDIFGYLGLDSDGSPRSEFDDDGESTDECAECDGCGQSAIARRHVFNLDGIDSVGGEL